MLALLESNGEPQHKVYCMDYYEHYSSKNNMTNFKWQKAFPEKTKPKKCKNKINTNKDNFHYARTIPNQLKTKWNMPKRKCLNEKCDKIAITYCHKCTVDNKGNLVPMCVPDCFKDYHMQKFKLYE